MTRFQDKVCLVTGGGSGIGQAACERFAQEGGKVVVVDLNPEHGNETVQKITQAGGQALFRAGQCRRFCAGSGRHQSRGGQVGQTRRNRQ